MTDAIKFRQKLTDSMARGMGVNIRVQSATTSQRQNQEELVTNLLRSNVTWGTPKVWKDGAFE